MNTKNKKIIITILVVLISLISCDRPLEPTDYLDNRTPIIGFNGGPAVFFLTENGDHYYEVFVNISSPQNTSTSYTISNDATSTLTENFILDGGFSIESGQYSGSFMINFDYDNMDAGVYNLYLNLVGEGDVQIGDNNQTDLTIVKN